MLPPVCLLDWGIGGFGVLRAIAAQSKGRGFELGYFSDSGTPPYGTLSAGELRGRLELVAHALAERGVRHLVLACNAASTVASSAAWPEGMRVTDVITHGIAAVRRSRVAAVGIVGGARTIRSGHHARALRRVGISVRARIAQPLSGYVERGILQGADVEQAIARVVAPLRGVPAVLLACTHYPALLPLFTAALPGVRLLDPADSMARVILHSMRTGAVPRAQNIVTLTSGSPEVTRSAAHQAFQIHPGTITRWLP